MVTTYTRSHPKPMVLTFYKFAATENAEYENTIPYILYLFEPLSVFSYKAANREKYLYHYHRIYPEI